MTIFAFATSKPKIELTEDFPAFHNHNVISVIRFSNNKQGFPTVVNLLSHCTDVHDVASLPLDEEAFNEL
ncbi:CLUMA_CG004782, isoform A [Clunio marinus]|uniref:CLUMA_CG004782, isoform A n=1 Tax=Clunio marinus TaxID=568069 RepID=A0A1J1HX42_9DIPT|nr:CLUMA_CG004782, isoform A [Clunio marinus]